MSAIDLEAESDSSEEDEEITTINIATKKNLLSSSLNQNGNNNGNNNNHGVMDAATKASDAIEDIGLALPGTDGYDGDENDEFGVGMNTGSSKFEEAKALIELDQWNVEAWNQMITEAIQNRCGKNNDPRDTLRRFLKHYPRAGRYWKSLAELEMKNQNPDAADKIFEEKLVPCACLEFWQYYIRVLKERMPSQSSRDEDEDAYKEAEFRLYQGYEHCLEHIGVDLRAGVIWKDYIDYIANYEEVYKKTGRLRDIYRRAISNPLDNLDEIWEEYEQFETNQNTYAWKNEVSVEWQPKYNASKTVYKDRKLKTDLLKLNKLAVPPKQNSREDQELLEAWNSKIAYELSNPEQITDDHGLQTRMRHTFRQCLCVLTYYPEVWYTYAKYEEDIKTTTNELQEDGTINEIEISKAKEIYQEGIEALPTSLLLHTAYAEFAEQENNMDLVKDIYIDYLSKTDCTLGYILFQKFVRRTAGKLAARKVFKSTKKLRKEGKLGYQIYLAHAEMEHYINGEPEIALNILEYGLSSHAEFIQETGYVLKYINMLIEKRDEKNTRALFERVLSTVTNQETMIQLWNKYIEFELKFSPQANLKSLIDLETKRDKQITSSIEKQPTRSLLKLYDRYTMYSTDFVTESDKDFKIRYYAKKKISETEGPADNVTGQQQQNQQQKQQHEQKGGKKGYQPTEAQLEATRRREEAKKEAEAAHQKRMEQVPKFLRNLFGLLPIVYNTPATDYDLVITTLRNVDLPPKPDKPEPVAPVERHSHSSKEHHITRDPRQRRGMKRKIDNDDDDDDDINADSKPAFDIFRNRQQIKLLNSAN